MRLLLGFAAALLLCAGIAPPASDGAKILAVFAFPGRSHSNMLNAVVRGLLAKGHELTVVSNFPLSGQPPNYTFVDITPEYDIWGVAKTHLQLDNVFQMHDMPMHKLSELLDLISVDSTEHALRHPNVQRLLHDTSAAFDLVLVEEFHQEAMLMFAHQFAAPLVSVASFETAQYFDGMFGMFGAWSHVPHHFLVLDDRMSFWQRVFNVQISLIDYYLRHFDYLPKQQALADKYFSHLPEPRPTIEQLNRNISVLLLNGHTPMTTVRPTVPAVVDVGGLHIEPVRALPADLQAFLDAAGPAGVIYFSLGTQLRSADMPTAQLDAFLRSFQRLGHVRFLWKWEDETVAARLPPNVMVKRWMPQNDILAHRNVRMFITHGGLLGTQEGVHHAVPMLGLPVYADQHLNMAKAQHAGYAISLSIDNVTDASLRWAFDELLENPRYATEVQRVSRIFRDRPEKPLDRAVYWIEYVIRHGGARHLRSAALDMPWLSYMLLDIVALGVATVVIVLGALWLLIRWVLGLLRGNGQKRHASKGKKNK